MGSKKHKRRREKYEERLFSLEDRPPGLKLILKVGGSGGTPEHQTVNSDENGGVYSGDYHERHKKSKKKKKKKDREKKHKHHHKEKRRHREDSSQEDNMSIGEDTQFQENLLRYSNITTASSLSSIPVTKPMIPLKSPEILITHDEISQMQNEHSIKINEMKMATPSSSSGETGREPRTCVLKLKQSKSPLTKLLDHLLRSLEKRDPHQFFAWPVTDDIAPGYSSIISKPMDFSTMKQKLDENAYSTLQEFSDDFKLMCDNAIKYNHVETVYHKAAKRLLHVGARLLQPENLMRSLRPLMNYMRELTSKELGFELPSAENQENESHIDSADEGGVSTEEGTSSQAEEDIKRKAMRLDNHPKSRFEPYVDEMSPDDILSQVQNAARNVRNRVIAKKTPHKMGFLRQNKDGTTSMKILLDVANDTPERLISLGAFTGKLQQGTGQLQTFREDRRNVAKIVKPLNYGAFSSFAPVYDSRFSNLTKEETELVFFTYGDEKATNYAESIMEFTKDSLYASTLANGLLDILTSGEHRKTMATLIESQRQKYEEKEVEKSFPDCKEDIEKYENVNIDFNGLKSLSNLGMDVEFLETIEKDIKLIEVQKKLQSQLDVNCGLIERLHQVQHERLSQPLPQHLAHVAKPNNDEIQLAAQLTTNLTEMAKQLAPSAIVSAHSLRKAMGMSTVGLEPFVQQRLSLNDAQPNLTNSNNLQQNSTNGVVDIDTTPVPMDLEPEVSLVHHHHLQASNAENSGSVDIETELREFLDKI